MNEIEIKQLPINDEFGQCMRKLRIVPTEFTQKRQEEIRNCNHLFVKLRQGKEVFGCHSTDYYKDANEVECVHCGLTNRFNRIEEVLDSEYIEFSKSFRGMIPSLTGYNKKTLDEYACELYTIAARFTMAADEAEQKYLKEKQNKVRKYAK